MAKRIKKTIPIPVIPATAKKSTIGGILNIIWLLFKWAFVFSSETCTSPLTWLIAMVLRGLIFYFVLLPYQDKIFSYFTLADGHTSIFFLPVGLFFLWYFFTSFLMFYGALKTGFGRTSTVNEGKYAEFEKLADYSNNRMRFQSYKDSLDMLTGKHNK